MTIEINAELRSDMGKGASRRLRKVEKLPAIVYGSDKEPVNLTVLQKDIRALLGNEALYSTILSLKIDGGKGEQVILRDLQHHPCKSEIMHMDFQRTDAKTMLHIHVPLHFIGEDKAPGVKQGGIVSHVAVEVEVECLPKDIPEFIEVDISGLGMDEILHLSDIKMPANVELRQLRLGEDHDAAVVSIHAPRAAVEAAAEEGEEASAEVPVVGSEEDEK